MSIEKCRCFVSEQDLLCHIVCFIASFVMGLEVGFVWYVVYLTHACMYVQYGIMLGTGLAMLFLLYPQSRPKIEANRRETLVLRPQRGMRFPGSEYFVESVCERALLMGLTLSQSMVVYVYVLCFLLFCRRFISSYSH